MISASTGSVADYILYSSDYNGSFVTLLAVSLTTRKFNPNYNLFVALTQFSPIHQDQ
jgi:hypothetical protein